MTVERSVPLLNDAKIGTTLFLLFGLQWFDLGQHQHKDQDVANEEPIAVTFEKTILAQPRKGLGDHQADLTVII